MLFVVCLLVWWVCWCLSLYFDMIVLYDVITMLWVWLVGEFVVGGLFGLDVCCFGVLCLVLVYCLVLFGCGWLC